MPPVPLPADFVARFKGKTVAITGHEDDAVRLNAETGEEEHVPLYDAYNHHHNAYLLGASAQLVDVGPAGSNLVRILPPAPASYCNQPARSGYNPHCKLSTMHWTTPGFISNLME